MKKFILLIVIMIISAKLYSQQSDSITYCEVPVYTIIEKSFFNMIDTMLFLEKSRGINVSSDSCYIRVNIHSEKGNVFQFDRFTGNTIDLAMSDKDSAIFVCYKKYLIWIAVGNNRITISELLKKTDKKIKFKCMSEQYEDTFLIEDDTELSRPHLTIFAYYMNNEFHIGMKMDENGNLY